MENITGGGDGRGCPNLHFQSEARRQPALRHLLPHRSQAQGPGICVAAPSADPPPPRMHPTPPIRSPSGTHLQLEVNSEVSLNMSSANMRPNTYRRTEPPWR
ncbi:unnamed protein product [Leuciscus chuanchicus]